MRSQERHTRKKFTGAIIALGIAVAACASDSDSTSESADTAAPAETEVLADTAAPVDTEAPPETQAPADTEVSPERVISLSPTHTEIRFAIMAATNPPRCCPAQQACCQAMTVSCI